MSNVKIFELLILPIKKLGIQGFTAYSIKHASTTKLAAMGIQERDLNMYTNHAPDTKSARNYYGFAANTQVNGTATRLITIDHVQTRNANTTTNPCQITLQVSTDGVSCIGSRSNKSQNIVQKHYCLLSADLGVLCSHMNHAMTSGIINPGFVLKTSWIEYCLDFIQSSKIAIAQKYFLIDKNFYRSISSVYTCLDYPTTSKNLVNSSCPRSATQPCGRLLTCLVGDVDVSLSYSDPESGFGWMVQGQSIFNFLVVVL
ncbi:MAG: hypothetical protein EZS28_045311 [Streblomastix strix]|uniref:Uncharacterized protein n=1 Tax=Streblomastix strix TaxID=222440 RepID=A0A5J4TMY4_9EUKA|nr:MAG: hypothetical protein EZS28_045311 [Streblomastix strix]